MSSPKQSCEVCRGSFTVDDVYLFLDVCDEHRTEAEKRRAEKALRAVIPPLLHHAHPRDLPVVLSLWKGEPGSGLYLYGPVGSGKSHAAAALLKRAYVEELKRGREPHPFWMNVPETILTTLNAISRRQDAGALWDMAQRASILVLDDIGIEQPKEWIRMRLYGLMEHRLNYQLPTIATSNLDLGQLADRLESPQIASRLSQMTAQVSFANQKDRRPGLAPTLTTEGDDDAS